MDNFQHILLKIVCWMFQSHLCSILRLLYPSSNNDFHFQSVRLGIQNWMYKSELDEFIDQYDILHVILNKDSPDSLEHHNIHHQSNLDIVSFLPPQQDLQNYLVHNRQHNQQHQQNHRPKSLITGFVLFVFLDVKKHCIFPVLSSKSVMHKVRNTGT